MWSILHRSAKWRKDDHNTNQRRTKRMQATARRLSVVSATSYARRRLIRDVRPRSRVHCTPDKMSPREYSFVLPVGAGLIGCGISVLLGSEFAGGLSILISGSVALTAELGFALWTGEIWQRSERYTRIQTPWSYWFLVTLGALLLGLFVFLAFRWLSTEVSPLGRSGLRPPITAADA